MWWCEITQIQVEAEPPRPPFLFFLIHNDRHLHDSAKPCPGITLKIMDKHRMAMMPSYLRLLYDRCSHLLTEWLVKEPNSTTENQYDLVAKVFGAFHPSQRKMLAFFSRNFAPL